jgi:hypothetical protein
MDKKYEIFKVLTELKRKIMSKKDLLSVYQVDDDDLSCYEEEWKELTLGLF